MSLPFAVALPFDEPSQAVTGAVLCLLVGGMFLTVMLGPRLVWPEQLVWAEPEAERPDWKWPWLVLAPVLLMACQLIFLPLRWVKGLPAEWVQFGAAAAGGILSSVAAWWLYCRRPRKPLAALGLRLPPWKAHMALLPIFGYPLGISALILAVIVQVFVFKRQITGPQEAIQVISKTSDPMLKALMGLTVCVTAPISEEILFRGVLFRGLRHRVGYALALPLSALAFGAIHLDTEFFLPLTALGLVLGFVAAEARSILPAIALHGIVNSVTFIITTQGKLPA